MKKLFLFLMLFAGCQAAPFLVSPIVTGIIMWKQGEAHKYYNEEPRNLYRATKLALKELDQPITTDTSKSDGSYYIVAGKEDRFKITVRFVKPHIAEVRVRVNFMGDKPYAELLYRQIDLHTNTIEFDDQGRPTKDKHTR